VLVAIHVNMSRFSELMTPKIEPERPAFKAGEALAQCLNPPAGEGVTVTQMAVRLPIAMKLKAANSHIKLEEAEYQELKAGVERTQWLALNEDIFAICKSVLDAQEIEVEEKKGK